MVRRNRTAAKIASDLESLMDELRPAAESDPKLAFFALLNACHDVLDRLEALDAAPPLSGGAPDDAESDPAEWPAWTDADRWAPTFDGPTPLGVLAASAPGPLDDEYDAWLDCLGSTEWSDADQIAVHGCC